MKDLINNIDLTQNGWNVIHLLELQVNGQDHLYLTDTDKYAVLYGTLYLPSQFTFSSIKENFGLTDGGITVTATNIRKDLMNAVLTHEWRNNSVKITRVFYNPNDFSVEGEGLYPSGDLFPSEDLYPSNGGEPIALDFGYGEAFTDFPKVNLDSVIHDKFTLFEGLIDSPTGNETEISLKCVTEFTIQGGKKIINNRSYDQAEFKSIINSMTEELIWK